MIAQLQQLSHRIELMYKQRTGTLLDWINDMVGALRPILDAAGTGLVVVLYESPARTRLVPPFMLADGLMPELRALAQRTFSPLLTQWLRYVIGPSSEHPGWSELEVVRDRTLLAHGVTNLFALSVDSWDCAGASFVAFHKSTVTLRRDEWLAMNDLRRAVLGAFQACYTTQSELADLRLHADHARPTSRGRWLFHHRPVLEQGESSASNRHVRFSLLSPRELEVLSRVAKSNETKTVAYDLGLADSTVRVLLSRAMSKLGIGSRDELLAAFREFPNA